MDKKIFLWTLTTIFFVGVILLYLPGLSGPFLLDDLQSIEPAHFQSFSLRNLLAVSLNNDTGPLGRPITIATFALNNYFWGNAPFSFKVTNLIIHILCGIALGYSLYLLMLLKPLKKSLALPIGLFTSILWLIHPLQVSTVLYAVQRMTQLAALFTLIGLGTYLAGRIRLNTQKPLAGWLLIASSFLLWFPLSVFSKETGILFPWYALCCEYFILQFRCPHPSFSLRLKYIHYSLSGSILLGAVIYFIYKLPIFLAIFIEKGFTLTQRLLTEISALVLYLHCILFPRLSILGFYHDDFALNTHIDFVVTLHASILLLCGFLIYYCRKRAPVIAFGLAWFFISHIIESTVLPLELIFEHRNYLASLGLLLPLVFYFILYLQKCKTFWKIFCSISALGVLLTLAFLTYYRATVFSSPTLFLKDALTFHPRSPRAHIETANAYLENNRYEEAFTELNTAQSLEPHNAGIALHKLFIHCKLPNVPESLYEEVLQKVQNQAISPYVIVVLNTMIHHMFSQQCPALDNHKIIQLIQMSYQNPQLTHKPFYKAVLTHLEAGLHLLNNNINQTRILLLRSYEIYPKRIDPLIEKALLEIQYHLIQEAQETIALIHQQNHFLQSSQEKLQLLDKALQSTQNKEV